ncbi:hypothetical protein GGI07_003287 [Coemansia sp. Benny D115]|nr:hypothetical protein GGI07_003287 [Coemansia sp. Benny D115]
MNATSRFTWYPKDDIAAFDRALSEYVNSQASTDEFQSVFRCDGLDDLGGFSTDHGTSVVRYHRSMICADILFSEDNIADCYGNKPRSMRRRDTEDSAELQLAKVVATSTIGVKPPMPMALCQNTCENWLESLQTIITNSTLCQPSRGINREASLESLRTKCQTKAYNGEPGKCIGGDENELRTCGYQRVEDWCRYCKHATSYADTCAKVGVFIKSNPGTSDADSNGKAEGGNPPVPTTSTRHPERNIIAELRRKAQQERAFRIAAIILGVAVGLFLFAILCALVVGHILGGRRDNRWCGFFGRGKDNGDDSTLVSQTTIGQPGKAGADFVDCFIANVGKPRAVVRHFFARREDEISLQQGDVVTLQMAFDDGWVVGRNLTTGGEGTFPLMCVMDSVPVPLPAQWSVLPEEKTASIEQTRNASATGAHRSPRASAIGSMSLPASLEAPPAALAASNSRISALTTSHGNQPQSTRTQNNPEIAESVVGQARGKTLLRRLLSAFGTVSTVSPFNTQEKFEIASPPKPAGPHVFRASHVAMPGSGGRPGDLSISTPAFMSRNSHPSLNGYPTNLGRQSLGSESGQSAKNDSTAPPAGFPRQPNFSYGEFAPGAVSRPTNATNVSVDTYHTADQFATGGLSTHPTMPAAHPRMPS